VDSVCWEKYYAAIVYIGASKNKQIKTSLLWKRFAINIASCLVSGWLVRSAGCDAAKEAGRGARPVLLRSF